LLDLSLDQDHVEFALRAVRAVRDGLKFDPSASQYTPELGKMRTETRRLSNLQISVGHLHTYISHVP
jgi:hypothetical protein